MPSQVNVAGATSGNNIKLDNVILDVYSQEVRFAAQPILRFASVAQKRTELGLMPGNTIKFLKYNPLTGSNVLTESSTMETKALSTSVIQIAVGERGVATAVSEFLLRSSLTDVMGNASQLLGMHYAKSVDGELRDALLSGSNIKYAGSAANRAGLTTSDVFNVDLIRDSVEFLATSKAPKFGGDAYIGFVHPHQARALRADKAWVNVNLYGNPENIYRGEIGRIEDVRFIETTMIPYIPVGTQNIWADGADTGTVTALAANANTDVYRAVIVGDYALGLAEALPVELRDNGVEDFGRKHSLAYYGIWGAGIIEAGHSVICETA